MPSCGQSQKTDTKRWDLPAQSCTQGWLRCDHRERQNHRSMALGVSGIREVGRRKEGPPGGGDLQPSRPCRYTQAWLREPPCARQHLWEAGSGEGGGPGLSLDHVEAGAEAPLPLLLEPGLTLTPHPVLVVGHRGHVTEQAPVWRNVSSLNRNNM